MNDDEGAGRFLPAGRSLDDLRIAARRCRGCGLYRDATQIVFSSGPQTATTVLVGEQPGDIEDRRGEPFVGPAGRLLRRAMGEAGIDLETSYLTNAVKHFKHHVDARGKRRIHDKPDLTEIRACSPWLAAELSTLRPRVVVALGATAAQVLAGASFRVTKQRGTLLGWPGAPDWARAERPRFLATIHPSAVLRSDDREEAYRGLVADLAVAAHALG